MTSQAYVTLSFVFKQMNFFQESIMLLLIVVMIFNKH